MPRSPKPLLDGQGVPWSGVRPGHRSRRGGRAENPETVIVRSCLEYAELDRRHVAAIIRVNSGQAFQGRRVFVAEGTLRLRDGSVLHLANRWVLLDPAAIQLAPEGTPDMIACLVGGRFAAIEAKTDEGDLSEAQREFLTRVSCAGGLPLIVRHAEELAMNLAAASTIRGLPLAPGELELQRKTGGVP